MKYYFLVIAQLLSINLISQDNTTQAFNKVKVVYNKSLICKGDVSQCSIYFNRDKKELDIGSYIIPLLSTKLDYNYDGLTNTKIFHYVEFSCIEESCIYIVDSKEIILGVFISFASKKDCYEFIDALSLLKNLIKN